MKANNVIEANICWASAVYSAPVSILVSILVQMTAISNELKGLSLVTFRQRFDFLRKMAFVVQAETRSPMLSDNCPSQGPINHRGMVVSCPWASTNRGPPQKKLFEQRSPFSLSIFIVSSLGPVRSFFR